MKKLAKLSLVCALCLSSASYVAAQENKFDTKPFNVKVTKTSFTVNQVTFQVSKQEAKKVKLAMMSGSDEAVKVQIRKILSTARFN